MSKPVNNTLTPRQEAFVTNYIITGNASQAAAKAGYSEKTARHQASRLLANVGVAKAIEQRQQSLQVQADYTISQWRQDLLSDIADAKESGSHSAVMKGRELLGRHIGALQSERQLAPEERQYLGLLEQAMLSTIASNSPKRALTQAESAREAVGRVDGQRVG